MLKEIKLILHFRQSFICINSMQKYFYKIYLQNICISLNIISNSKTFLRKRNTKTSLPKRVILRTEFYTVLILIVSFFN